MNSLLKIWLKLVQLYNQLRINRQYEDDAEQVTTPVPAPSPVVEPIKEKEEVKSKEPVYIPEPASTLLILDAGHYRETAGKRAYHKEIDTTIYEWDINRQIVSLLYEEVQKNRKNPDTPNIDVIVSNFDWDREKGEYKEFDARKFHSSKGTENLYYRNNRINQIYGQNKHKYKSIIYLSVHHNAFREPNVSGHEIYYHGLGNNQLSQLLGREMVLQLDLNNFVMRPKANRADTMLFRRGFSTLRNVDVPIKLLLELGYMTNLHDARKMMLPYHNSKKVKTIISSIINFIKS